MVDWLHNFISSAWFSLFVGAFLAALTGYVAETIRESRHREMVRQKLGTLLHGELEISSPRDYPIYSKPDHAMRHSLPSVPQLLAPGILDPVRDEQIMMSLIQINKIINEFNERAALWDQAYAAGSDKEKLFELSKPLQFSNLDYKDAHEGVLAQLWQLGPPIPLYEQGYTKPTLREKLADKRERWRTRNNRKAWSEYKQYREDPFGHMTDASSPRATRRAPARFIRLLLIILLLLVIGSVLILSCSA